MHDTGKDGKDRKIAVNALYSLPCKKNPEVTTRRLLFTAPSVHRLFLTAPLFVGCLFPFLQHSLSNSTLSFTFIHYILPFHILFHWLFSRPSLCPVVGTGPLLFGGISRGGCKGS